MLKINMDGQVTTFWKVVFSKSVPKPALTCDQDFQHQNMYIVMGMDILDR